MTIEVIILAQGPRRRPVGGIPRQFLRLPACAGIPIMLRTVRQVFVRAELWPTILSWESMRAHVAFGHEGMRRIIMPAHVELADPGNSSLKGIARYLDLRGHLGKRFDRTIVLLGDVVYSWACLDALWKMSEKCGFVGTSNLTEDRGDLWGVAWNRQSEAAMTSDLRDALLRQSPVEDDHQPGQLRRWVTGWHRGELRSHVAQCRKQGMYVDIDDYTHNVDVPHDIVLLPELSAAGASDDTAHEMSWEGVSWRYGLSEGGTAMTGG